MLWLIPYGRSCLEWLRWPVPFLGSDGTLIKCRICHKCFLVLLYPEFCGLYCLVIFCHVLLMVMLVYILIIPLFFLFLWVFFFFCLLLNKFWFRIVRSPLTDLSLSQNGTSEQIHQQGDDINMECLSNVSE